MVEFWKLNALSCKSIKKILKQFVESESTTKLRKYFLQLDRWKIIYFVIIFSRHLDETHPSCLQSYCRKSWNTSQSRCTRLETKRGNHFGNKNPLYSSRKLSLFNGGSNFKKAKKVTSKSKLLIIFRISIFTYTKAVNLWVAIAGKISWSTLMSTNQFVVPHQASCQNSQNVGICSHM